MRVSMSPRLASLDLPLHRADHTVPRERWNVSQSAPCTHALCAQANGIRSLNKQLTGLQGVLLIDDLSTTVMAVASAPGSFSGDGICVRQAVRASLLMASC